MDKAGKSYDMMAHRKINTTSERIAIFLFEEVMTHNMLSNIPKKATKLYVFC